MDPISYQSHPSLSRPVLIAAFQGWTDAGDAASTAVRHLEKAWNATRYASIDPEEFYDFTVRRPRVKLVDGHIRRIEWPSNTFSHARLPGADRDVILFSGEEPSTRWRTFSSAVVDLATRDGTELVITMGAMLSPIPHTWPVPVTATSNDPQLASTLGFSRSRYEGPTGIVGVLHDAFQSMHIPTASLWAQVPVYLQNNPSPKAALELVRRLGRLLGAQVDTDDLEQDAARYEEEVSEAVQADPDILAQVAELEREASEAAGEIPSGDELAAELERYLKDLRGES